MASKLIAEAITDYFGERCLDYAEGCPTCEAWAEYDRIYTRPAPAATDTGLEIVGYTNKNYTSIWRGEQCCNPEYKIAVVARSQAEELLAAERAEKEELAAKNQMLENYIEDLKNKKRITESEVYSAVSAFAKARKALKDVVDQLDDGNGYRQGSLKKFTHDVLGV